jgi:hypothetical protein
MATAVNTAFMGLATKAIDTFWMGVNGEWRSGTAAIVERMIEANHRLHNVQRRYNLPMFWNDQPIELTFMAYGSRPASHFVFDRIPLIGGTWNIESGLLLANRRLAVQERFEMSNDSIAPLWVPPEEEKMRAVFDHMAKLDRERVQLLNAARKVVSSCHDLFMGGRNTAPQNVTEQVLGMTCEVLPVLGRVMDISRQRVALMQVADKHRVNALLDVDMGAILPAIVRIERDYHVDT